MVSDQEKGVAPALVHVCCAARRRRAGGKQIFSSQHGGHAAVLGFIVKQPGAVSGSVETEGEEGREVERQAG